MNKQIRPVDESDAAYWEATAACHRKSAAQAHNYESRQIYLRDADNCDEFAARIRRVLARRAASV